MRIALVTLLLVAVCALYATWFFTTHEKVVVEQPAEYQGEARINDFLAAELLLRELGYEADSRSSLTPSDWLPETADTLFVRLSAAFAAAPERDLLYTWVVDGGHLVLLGAEQSVLATDEFLGHFGFNLVEIEPAAESSEEPGLAAEPQADSLSSGYSIDLDTTWRRIEMTRNQVEDAALFDERGAIAARRSWGAGVVTVIAGSSFFGNRMLAERDHARLLLDAVAGYIPPGKVWFIYDARFPALWQVIWDNAPYVVAGTALTLLFWLWSVIPRFGPSVSPVLAARRSIVEHVGAAGQFVWRHRGGAALAASSTAAVVHRAESRHPGISRLPVQEQAALIAKMTRQPAPAVLDALERRGAMGQREFTQRIQVLQAMRNEL